MQLTQATRVNVKPLICLYGESGSGKTYSALMLARGLAGKDGSIAMLDTESGRGSLYADVIPGGYKTLQLDEPFSPIRAIEAISTIEKSGANVGCCDSASHFWEGIGGVLAMADANEDKSGKAGLHNWRKPKMEHALFLQKLLRSTIPWIVCLRAKYRTRQAKENGKTVIVKDDSLTPIQADDFIFEMTAHGWIDLQHNFWPTKISHPALAACLPNGKPITLEHGMKLAQWCAAPGASETVAFNPSTFSDLHPKPTDDKRTLQTELRTVTESIHGWKKGDPREKWENEGRQKLESWLLGQGIIGDAVTLADLSVERLGEVLAETKAALRGGGNLL